MQTDPADLSLALFDDITRLPALQFISCNLQLGKYIVDKIHDLSSQTADLLLREDIDVVAQQSRSQLTHKSRKLQIGISLLGQQRAVLVRLAVYLELLAQMDYLHLLLQTNPLLHT